MQPDDLPDSLAAIKHLVATGEYFSTCHLMVRDSDLLYLDLVLICLTSAIITPLLGRLHVGGGELLHVANICGVIFFIRYATIMILRKC